MLPYFAKCELRSHPTAMGLLVLIHSGEGGAQNTQNQTKRPLVASKWFKQLPRPRYI